MTIPIASLHAREVLDSRGTPTIEVTAGTRRFSASAIVPSGASTGSHEALELRDLDERRYFGKGVLKAVANVNSKIAKKILGMNVGAQRTLDEALIHLDGTKNKSRLGANAILGVSLACAKLAALEAGVPFYEYIATLNSLHHMACPGVAGSHSLPRDIVVTQPATSSRGHIACPAGAVSHVLLPVPMMNVINGGVHADSGLEFQEMMIVPAGAPNFREALRMGAEIFHALKQLISERGFQTTVGDEGGFAPRVASHEVALDLIMKAIEKAHYKGGHDVVLALDTASSEFYQSGTYIVTVAGKKRRLESSELVAYFEKLVKKYPIASIEDGCSEDDWSGWKVLTDRLGKKILLVGDDLFVTNPGRLTRGIESKVAHAILVKLNQIGTLTETMDVMQQANGAGYKTIVSHRSGETEDTTISHLSVGMAAGAIKTGSLSRTERIAKYNELLRIEEALGRRAKFSGRSLFTLK